MLTFTSRALLLATLAGGSLLASSAIAVPQQADPLPSWNEGVAKQRIIRLVERVTTPGSAEYVAPAERIATFDNDGTLWVEKPLPTEVYFVLDRLRRLAESDPSLRTRQPYKAALEGDAVYFHRAGPQAVVDLLLATETDMSQEAFAREAKRFLDRELHPTRRVRFTRLAYQPMLELLVYLRANGFETWLCSGGTTDFMRAFAEDIYGIPASRTIGSEVGREFRTVHGERVVWRIARAEPPNDKGTKPVNIDRHIGRRPLIAVGNVMSGGDVAMLEYSRGRKGPSLQLIVHHDDAAREFSYEETDSASLRAAAANAFVVVSMRNDWNTIFPR